jgi:phytoene dehydrogenase-like protein
MRLARLAIDRLTTHVPGFASLVIEQHTATPYDLAHIHGFPQGQAYHAELALDQALWMRPVPQLSRYRTPIEGLYLCGPAMHPGGGIIGAAGANAARIVLGDLQKRKK